MAEKNRISLTISDKDLSEIKAAIEVLKVKLLPLLKTLTPDERRELVKMGDKSIPFVQKGLEYAQKIAAIVPVYVDLAEFAKDVEAVAILRDISRDLEAILSAVDDSLTLAGHEAYATGLLIYGGTKGAAKNGVPGAEAAANDLGARFAGIGKKKA